MHKAELKDEDRKYHTDFQGLRDFTSEGYKTSVDKLLPPPAFLSASEPLLLGFLHQMQQPNWNSRQTGSKEKRKKGKKQAVKHKNLTVSHAS